MRKMRALGKKAMKTTLLLVLKGIGMGAANVIPGVSGGTIALITGIFERLIFALKSFDVTAARLLLKGDLRGFAQHIDLYFLASVMLGVALAIVSLARLFDYLFKNYPVYIWAYFFGLVLASVWFVGKTITHWKASVLTTFVLGTLTAVLISLLTPTTENSHFVYLVVCGVIAICSMILPGLSGSFILILMGNYKLMVIDAINHLNLQVLIPFAIGAGGGLLLFSHLLSWVLKSYRDETISLLTGFILGSLSILWPWQKPVFMLDAAGNAVLKAGEPIVVKYSRYLPDGLTTEVWIAAVLMILGIISIWLTEKLAKGGTKTSTDT